MTEEARQLEPVRIFTDEGDKWGRTVDFAPRIQRVKPDDDAPTEGIHMQGNAPGYDPEHGIWLTSPVKDELAKLTHPLDDPELSKEDVATAEAAIEDAGNDLPKAQTAPAKE